MKQFFKELCQLAKDNWRNPANRPGFIWRIVVCPVAIPMRFIGELLIAIQNTISYGEFEWPKIFWGKYW